MKNDEAKAIVQVHSMGNNGYAKAVRALINNYGSPTLVYPHLVMERIQSDLYSYDRDSLRRLRQRYLLTYDAMEELGELLSLSSWQR